MKQIHIKLSGSLRKEKSLKQNYQFKFIDLFSGIGGLRIPFDELNGECVFSTEYQKRMSKAPYGAF